MRARFIQMLVDTLRACGAEGAARSLETRKLSRIAAKSVRRMQKRFRSEGYGT